MRPTKPAAISATKKSVSLYPDQWAWIDNIASERFNGNRSKAIQATIDQAMDINMTALNEPNKVNESGATYGDSMQLRLDRIESKLNNAVNEGAVLNAIAGTQEMSRDEIAKLFFDGFMQRLGRVDRVVEIDSNAEKTTNKK